MILAFIFVSLENAIADRAVVIDSVWQSINENIYSSDNWEVIG